MTEVVTVLQKLFTKYSDVTERYLHVGNKENKNYVNKVLSGNYTFFDDVLSRSSAYEKLVEHETRGR